MNTVEIPLNQGKVAIIDVGDAPLVAGYKWYAKWGRGTWYVQAYVPGTAQKRRYILLHRLLLGLTDPKQKVDHWDGDGLNNRRKNLRRATDKQNAQNRRKRRTSFHRYKGTYPTQNKANPWRAIIQVNGKRLNIGVFPTEKSAARACDSAAREHFGEFARLNFPDSRSAATPLGVYHVPRV